jgi:puromycin-sensitive aminopeptidase
VLSSTPTTPGLALVQFADTPVMSSYLLAWVVGEFDYLEGHTASGTTVRVYTPQGRHVKDVLSADLIQSDAGKSELGTHALTVALKALPFYESYFNMPYPLTKLDMVSIPDFAAGLFVPRPAFLLFGARDRR